MLYSYTYKEVKVYNVWENILAEIKQKISSANYSTWFKDTSLVSTDGGHIIIGVKNSFHTKQLTVKYHDLITEALKNNNVEVVDIHCEIIKSDKSRVRRGREVTAGELARDTTNIRRPSGPTPTRLDNGLNSKYTLDSFVIGSNNDVAYAAAKSIIESPGNRYNPFFLYGGPGLGKTHLVQAIGNELVKKDPSYKVL